MRILYLTLMLGWLVIAGCKEPAPPGTNTPDDVTANQPGETERVKAEAGVGKQGQIIGDKEGIIRTPVKAYFNVKQRAEFMKVDYALKLYEAEHGYKPKTEEEFMSKIVEFNQIQLPELPEGQKYVWDAEGGELMVEKPKTVGDSN